jgi:hypothetical protein
MKRTNSRLRRRKWKASDLISMGECPMWVRSCKLVRIEGDVFSLPVRQIDYLFAVFASNQWIRFRISGDPTRYYARVSRLSSGAAERYERRMRAHFRRYKMRFTEGYSLPGAPTPELRFIYDSAAKTEGRKTRPDGTTIWCGFSGGEYHWRQWPLTNVECLP